MRCALSGGARGGGAGRRGGARRVGPAGAAEGEEAPPHLDARALVAQEAHADLRIGRGDLALM